MKRQFLCGILFCFSLSLCAAEERLLVTGLSLHETSHSQLGKRYNAYNVGLGYEYNGFQEYDRWYFHSNVMAFNDSFRNPQLIVGFGHAKRFDYDTVDVALGIAGFVGWKKLYDAGDTTGHTGEYGLMGGVAPALTLYGERLSLNLIYVPSITFKERHVTGFLFAYFGWKL